jgi:hypothetical protein
MKEILLTQGKVTLVDDDIFDYLSKYKWSFNGGYASKAGKKSGSRIMMHRLIMDCPKGMDIDHINLNKLDNQKRNLRICTRSENQANVKLVNNNTTGYKGVCFDKSNNNWCAYITKNYTRVNIGSFKSPEKAAEAYDRAAKELFGGFAKTNKELVNV